MEPTVLADGTLAVPPGRLATVVTCLEMTEAPRPKAVRPQSHPLALARLEPHDLDGYRALYRAVGENWLWWSRLALSDSALGAILQDTSVEAFALVAGRRRIGLLELDFRESGACELAFFGLVPDATGQGLGRHLMDQALKLAWARPISRFWVHTCHYDHPSALGFYRKAGFRASATYVEIMPDPRLSGVLPETAAPHVPLAR